MGNYDDPQLDTDRPAPRRRRWPLVAAVLAALVVGVVGGYLLRAGTEPDTDLRAANPTAPAPAPPTATPDPEPPPCLEAGRVGAVVLEQLEAGVQAIGRLDPTALREVLDRLQPLQSELEQAVTDCSDEFSSRPSPTLPPPPGIPTG